MHHVIMQDSLDLELYYITGNLLENILHVLNDGISLHNVWFFSHF